MDQSSSSTHGSLLNNSNDKFAGLFGHNNPLAGSWASKLLATSDVAQDGWKLKQADSADPILMISETDILDVNEWGFCLVGFFVGPFPGMAAVDKLCKSWNTPFELMSHKSGWLIFKFKNSLDRATVMEKGPFNVYGRPLLLKILPEYFLFEEDFFNKIPLWIQLSEIPIECWTPNILSRISSYVGNPICTDGTTANLQRLSYARVLVEVDITKPLVRNVLIQLPNGVKTEVVVTYEYEPRYCANCKSIGHNSDSCKNGIKESTGTVAGPAPNPIAGPKKWRKRSASAKKVKGKPVETDNLKHGDQVSQLPNNNLRSRSKSVVRNNDRKDSSTRGRSKNPPLFRDFIGDMDSGKEADIGPKENQDFTLVKKKKYRKRGSGGGGPAPT